MFGTLSLPVGELVRSLAEAGETIGQLRQARGSKKLKSKDAAAEDALLRTLQRTQSDTSALYNECIGECGEAFAHMYWTDPSNDSKLTPLKNDAIEIKFAIKYSTDPKKGVKDPASLQERVARIGSDTCRLLNHVRLQVLRTGGMGPHTPAVSHGHVEVRPAPFSPADVGSSPPPYAEFSAVTNSEATPPSSPALTPATQREIESALRFIDAHASSGEQYERTTSQGPGTRPALAPVLSPVQTRSPAAVTPYSQQSTREMQDTLHLSTVTPSVQQSQDVEPRIPAGRTNTGSFSVASQFSRMSMADRRISTASSSTSASTSAPATETHTSPAGSLPSPPSSLQHRISRGPEQPYAIGVGAKPPGAGSISFVPGRKIVGAPAKSNDYWGLCKGAWAIQSEEKKSLSVRTVPLGHHSRRTYIECSASGCAFQGRHCSRDAKTPTLDQNVYVHKTTRIRFRWIFLAKSHKTCVARDEGVGIDPHAQMFGCLFCIAKSTWSPTLGGIDSLMNHVLAEHCRGAMIDALGGEEVRRRNGVVVGRLALADENPHWDLNIPAMYEEVRSGSGLGHGQEPGSQRSGGHAAEMFEMDDGRRSPAMLE